MIGAMLLLALAQGDAWTVRPARPTVGDTITLERRLPAPAGAMGRSQPVGANDVVEPLGAPVVTVRDGAVVVRHHLALFAPGPHALPMPLIELIAPDGHVEIVAGDTAVVTVASVLPDTGGPPAPRASVGPVARPVQRIEPLVFATAAVVILLIAWGMARRRTRPRPLTEPGALPVLAPPVGRWLAAGEGRAVTSLAADQLRARIAAFVPDAARSLDTPACLAVVAGERPDWPLGELADLLHALDRARFAPLVPDDAIALTDRVELMIDEIERTAQVVDAEVHE